MKSFAIAALIALCGISALFSMRAAMVSESNRDALDAISERVVQLDARTGEYEERLAALERSRSTLAGAGARREGTSAPELTLDAGADLAAADAAIPGRASASTSNPVKVEEQQLDELAALVEGKLRANPEALPADAIDERVRESIQAVQEEQARAEQERRRERRLERVQSRVRQYSERLQLHPTQEEDLIAVISTGFEKFEEIGEKARQGEIDWPDARPLFQEQRAALDTEIQTVLSASQFEEYKKIREEDPALGGRFGMGFPRGARGDGSQAGTTSSETTSPPPAPAPNE